MAHGEEKVSSRHVVICPMRYALCAMSLLNNGGGGNHAEDYDRARNTN